MECRWAAVEVRMRRPESDKEAEGGRTAGVREDGGVDHRVLAVLYVP